MADFWEELFAAVAGVAVHPIEGGGVAVDVDEVFGLDGVDELDEFLAVGVGTEVKPLDVVELERDGFAAGLEDE